MGPGEIGVLGGTPLWDFVTGAEVEYGGALERQRRLLMYG